MTPDSELNELLAQISREPDYQRSLDFIVSSAIRATRSRHAMIAVINEEIGQLEICAGAGLDFKESHKNQRIPVDVGKAFGIVGYVAATGADVLSGNVKADPHYKQLFTNTRSEIATPVSDLHGRIRAVVNVESDEEDAYTESDLLVMHSLASLTSIVLERSANEKRQRALIETGTTLDTATTEESLVDRVIQVAEEILRFQACSIFLLDSDRDRFVLRGTVGHLKREVGTIAYQKGEGFTGWVGETGEPIMLEDPQSDPRWRGKYVEFPSPEIASFLAVPINTRDKCIGVIRVLRRKSENQYLDVRFDTNDLRLLQAIAEQVAVGLENLRSLERIVRSERMVAWGELSAKSSHMIGNRVFALKGDVNEFGHLLKEIDAPGHETELAEMRSIQASLATNVTRVEEILQDFRDFLTATQIRREPTDLNKIVRETLAEVFPRRSEVDLQIDLEDTLPLVPLDEKRIRRAVSELVENSLNYMDRGELCVTTKKVRKSEYDVTRNSKIPFFARITIEDSGPGVETDQKGIIFQPFFSKRVKGMGLGLSIVKGIVDAHGGYVFEAGKQGSGAKFVILLPL